MRKFGVGEKTGIPLPGESPGILADWRNWDGRQQYTVLFGQGVAQTPLQTTMIFQTIANNGVRLKPALIDSFTHADGTVDQVPQAPGVEVVSPATAQAARDMLEGVVTMTDYKVVNIPGYRTGGKTGPRRHPPTMAWASTATPPRSSAWPPWMIPSMWWVLLSNAPREASTESRRGIRLIR